MSADMFVTYLTWGFYLLVFVVTLARALRQPRRANVDIALFFSVTTIVIVLGVLGNLGILHPSPVMNAINGSLLLSLSYLLLRLVEDFASPPSWLVPAAGAGWLLLSAGLFFYPPPRPGWLTEIQLLYFIGAQFYAAIAFIRQSRRTSGVTSRRMRAVAGGFLLLGLAFVGSSLTFLFPALATLARLSFAACSLASGLCYFVGFATPGWLRRAWQEPELRAFLGRAASLPRLPDTAAILDALEHGAATSIGAPNARIGLWDESAQALRYRTHENEPTLLPITPESPSGRTFLTQQPILEAKPPKDNRAYAAARRNLQAEAILAAPITAGEKRLGVLTVYAPRAPIFADDDLELVQLLADQAAVILESRSLIDEASRVQAREEVTRLKDDFLSVAAHDLKTPLTTLVGQAQLMERRALRQPDAPADLAGIQRLVQEGQRLKTLVLELLDASRAEQGRLVGERESFDLAALLQERCERSLPGYHQLLCDIPAPVIGAFDRNRILQLFDNLLENAIKYSPQGGEIQVRVWQESGRARFSLTDPGIGILPDDLPHLFDRFYRGGNVDDRRHAGMGLGLFICHGIAEQHGGRIWATSQPGHGSTFHVELPLLPAEAPHER